MTFSGHRTNYRAWAIGPSNVPETLKPQRQLLDYLAVQLNPVQTMFWRPDRTRDVIRTAFGMDYPAFRPTNGGSNSETGYRDIWQVPESSEQRLSVFIQLKKDTETPSLRTKPSLGLSENTLVITDSMRKNVTSDELLDGGLSLNRLMYNADVKDPLVGNPVLVAAIRLIFDAVAGKWSDYILAMHNYIVAVEEVIYSEPANDVYSPLLWTISKRLLQAERLIKFHLHLLENVQTGLTDITGQSTMGHDWLSQSIKEFARLSIEIEESLRKPVAQMVDLVRRSYNLTFSGNSKAHGISQMYKSIGIRDCESLIFLR